MEHLKKIPWEVWVGLGLTVVVAWWTTRQSVNAGQQVAQGVIASSADSAGSTDSAALGQALGTYQSQALQAIGDVQRQNTALANSIGTPNDVTAGNQQSLFGVIGAGNAANAAGLTNINSSLTGVGDTLGSITTTLGGVNTQLGTIQSGVAGVSGQVAGVSGQVSSVAGQVTAAQQGAASNWTNLFGLLSAAQAQPSSRDMATTSGMLNGTFVKAWDPTLGSNGGYGIGEVENGGIQGFSTWNQYIQAGGNPNDIASYPTVAIGAYQSELT